MKQHQNVKDIASDPDFWAEHVFENYPSIIANEYSRLQQYCKDGNTFGTLLQLKQVLEVVIKFPILVFMSYLWQSKDKAEIYELYSCFQHKLFKDTIALGDWVKIIYRIQKNINIIQSESIKKYFESLFNKKFNSEFDNITKWRNNEIGHGALKYEDSPELFESIADKILFLKNYFNCNKKVYESSTLFADFDDQRYNYKGKYNYIEQHDYTIDKQHEEINLPVYIQIENELIHLFPLIRLAKCTICEKSHIFIYESKNKKKFFILDYIYAHKINISSDDELRILNTFGNTQGVTTHATIVINDLEDYVQADMIKILDDLDKEIEKPDKILKSILKEYNENNNSVLLQAEEGAGKSTLCKYLAGKNDCKNFLFIIKNDYRYGINSLIHKFVSFFTTNIELVGNAKPLPRFDYSSNNKPIAFREYINGNFKILKKTGINKLLIILDGLDELPIDEINMLDLFSDSTMFEKGIKFLFTSRRIEDLNYDNPLISKLKNIGNNGKLILFDNKQIENVATLKKYLNANLKYIFGDNDEKNRKDLIRRILIKSKYNFSKAAMFKDLFLSGSLSLADFDNLPFNDFSYINDFLDNVYKLYPQFAKEKLRSLLSILASCYQDGFNHREIVYLLNEPYITIQYLAILADIKMFYDVLRSDEKNRYIIKSKFKKPIKENLGDFRIRILKNSALIFINDVNTNNIDLKNDGFIYCMTYLGEMIDEVGDNAFDKTITPSFLDVYVKAVINFINKPLTTTNNVYKQIEICRNAEIVIKVASEYNNYELLYDFYYQLVKRYFTVMKYKNIIKYSEIAQEYFSRIDTNKSNFMDKYSEIIYWKSKSLYESGKYQNALNEVSHNLAKQLKKSNCPLFINSTIVSIKAKIALIRSFKEVNSDISKALKITQGKYKQQYLEMLFLKFDFLLKHNLYYDSKKIIKKIMINTAARLNPEDNLILGKLYLKRAKMEYSYIFAKELETNSFFIKNPITVLKNRIHNFYNRINPILDIDFSLRFYIEYYEKFPEKKLFFEIANIVIFFTDKYLYAPSKLQILTKMLHRINPRLDKLNLYYDSNKFTYHEKRIFIKYLYSFSKIKFLLEEYSSAETYVKKALKIRIAETDINYISADLYYLYGNLLHLKNSNDCFNYYCMALELYSKKHTDRLFDEINCEEDIDLNIFTLFVDFCSIVNAVPCENEIIKSSNLFIDYLDKLICIASSGRLLIPKDSKALTTRDILTETLSVLKAIEKELLTNNNISFEIRNHLINKIHTLKKYKKQKFF